MEIYIQIHVFLLWVILMESNQQADAGKNSSPQDSTGATGRGHESEMGTWALESGCLYYIG